MQREGSERETETEGERERQREGESLAQKSESKTRRPSTANQGKEGWGAKQGVDEPFHKIFDHLRPAPGPRGEAEGVGQRKDLPLWDHMQGIHDPSKLARILPSTASQTKQHSLHDRDGAPTTTKVSQGSGTVEATLLLSRRRCPGGTPREQRREDECKCGQEMDMDQDTPADHLIHQICPFSPR